MADAKLVKQLRDATGASVLDCKNALDEHGGDLEKAKEYLAKRGLAKAAKKAGRATREGEVITYSHTGGRVGVMVEVNCETDFVARNEQFQTFAKDIALHIAFSNPDYLNSDEIPEDVMAKQVEIFTAEAKNQGKPDNIVEKIVDGKISKWKQEVCLLDQAFVKDDKISIQDLITKTIADLGENINVTRFARFELGESVDEA